MVKKYTELSKEEEHRAVDIHKKAIGINALSLFRGRGGRTGVDKFRSYCKIMKDGGVSAVNLTIASSENMGETCSTIAEMYNLIQAAGAVLIRTAEDIREAKKLGKAGIIFGFQNTETLERIGGALELYYNLGVRVIQLTYSQKTRAGDGNYERTDCGASRYGLDLIEEMNRLGILIDLSHCGTKTTLEAIEASEDAVAFTHSGAKGVNNFARLKGDEEIKAMAEKGGVMGIIAESNFIRYEGGLKKSRATLEDLLDHIDYVRDLVGVDHIGIGGDLPEVNVSKSEIERAREEYTALRKRATELFREHPDPVKYPDYWYQKNTYYETMWVEGFDTMAKTLNVTRGLVARGYSDNEITGILGGNFLRLFEKVWRK